MWAMNNLRHFIVALVGLCTLTAAASAQSGPALLVAPWDAEQSVRLSFDALLFGDADVEDTRADLELTWYEAQGGMRFASPRGQAETPRVGAPGMYVGFDVDYLDLDGGMSGELTDQSIGVGTWFGQPINDWQLGVVAGVGYAGENPYAVDEAWYGHATLIARKQVGDDAAWMIMLNYDGNRSIFPDIPLPAIAYQKTVSDRLVYTLGLPRSGVFWRPTDRFFLNANYTVPFTVDAKATYAVTQQVHVYGAFYNRFEAFAIEGMDDDRLFFSQRRLEGGLEWRVNDNFDLLVAGGYAFGQEFSTGWHAIDTDNQIEVDDTPYLRAGVSIQW
jgi:hypothetical protein